MINAPEQKERIQKLLAAGGCGSRHACEQMVLDGRVRVNGRVIRELPLLVNSRSDQILVDGRPLQAAKSVFLMLNKPPGFACTLSPDPNQRTLSGLLSREQGSFLPVGRMEAECAGLVLLTNDREAARRLGDAQTGLDKTYRVEVRGSASSEAMAGLRGGLRLSEGRTAKARVKVIHANRDRTLLEIVTNDQLRRELWRSLARHGLKVKRMVRVQMGRLSIRRLPIGAARPLLPDEMDYVRKFLAGLASSKADHGGDDTRTGRMPPKPRRDSSRGTDRVRVPDRRSTSSTQRRPADRSKPSRSKVPKATKATKSPQPIRGGSSTLQKTKRRMILPEG